MNILQQIRKLSIDLTNDPIKRLQIEEDLLTVALKEPKHTLVKKQAIMLRLADINLEQIKLLKGE